MKVGVFIEFANKEMSRPGMPLPKGAIRVHQTDAAGNVQFVGDDNGHTPKNEKVRLKLGTAFDVMADRKQTGYKRLPDPSRHIVAYASAFEIVLRKAKQEPVLFTMPEPIPGDWEITSENLPPEKSQPIPQFGIPQYLRRIKRNWLAPVQR
jgi:hypothetical protein